MKSVVALLFGIAVFAAVHAAPRWTEPTAIVAKESDFGLQPRVAVQDDGTILVVYGRADALLLVRSHDGGRTFDAPGEIAKLPKLHLGMRRGPRVAVHGQTITVTAQNDDLWAWLSTDAGRTWSTPVRVNSEAGSAREGLHDLAVTRDGGLVAAWLDLRGTGTKLFTARSSDHGRTWLNEQAAYQSPDGHICECCHPSLAAASDGTLQIMWRNWLGGSRDLYVMESRDGAKSFGAARKQGTGTWPLKGCPMDGGAILKTPDGDVHTLWRRDTQLYFSTNGGTEQLVSAGRDPVLVNSGAAGLIAVWQQDGDLWSAPVADFAQRARIARDADDPTPALAPDGTVLLVWQNRGKAPVALWSARLSPAQNR